MEKFALEEYLDLAAIKDGVRMVFEIGPHTGASTFLALSLGRLSFATAFGFFFAT